MIEKLEYKDKQFSFGRISKNNPNNYNPARTSDIIKVIGISAAINIIPVVIKLISKRFGTKRSDELLQSRNDRLNRLTDNYNVEGLPAKTDIASKEKYSKEIHALYEETLKILRSRSSINEQKDGDLYINVNQDQYGSTRSVSKAPVDKDTILYQYINPLIVVLKMILIQGVHVVPGTGLGADRRNFELVFAPDKKSIEDVIRDPFRTVIFKHPWPSHGFEVSTRGQLEANKLIDSVIDFLSSNPKFLSIRVR